MTHQAVTEIGNDGGPAFPTPSSGMYSGMSLRDWFAGMAFQGLLASDHFHQSMNGETFEIKCESASHQALRYANSMLAERAK